MVQPGQKLEENLFQWRKHFHTLRCPLSSVLKSPSTMLTPAQQSNPDSDVVHYMPVESRTHDLTSVQTSSPIVQASSSSKTGETSMAEASPLAQHFFILSTQPAAIHSPVISNVGPQRNFQLDELLYFAQNKLLTTPMESVVQICRE